MIRLSRRRFITLSSGLVVAGCSGASELAGTTSIGTPSTTAPAPPTTLPAGTVPATAPPSTVVTSIAADDGLVSGDRILVMVELAGGNDALNTLPPLGGPYQALRPSLALTDDEMVDAGLGDYALHGSLATLLPLVEQERLAFLAGIGFDDPDRSHFVSIDRWHRADRMEAPMGWLGRWLDQLADDLPSLGATTLGGGGRILLGAERRGTVINTPESFAFPTALDPDALAALAVPSGDDPLVTAAQRAYATSIAASAEFAEVAAAARAESTDDGTRGVPGGGAFSTGLAVAGELIAADAGTRVITITGGGFDTHSGQKAVHAGLLGDLASGLAGFWERMDAEGLADRVLLATHSEFGRRVAENGSDGCDHGAAGLSLLMGPSVSSGVHGALDTTDLVQGDLRPVIDPRTLFTACLDWLGADVESVLGSRYDQVPLLA